MKKKTRRIICIALMVAMLMTAVSFPAPTALASDGTITLVFVIGQSVHTVNGVLTSMDVSPTIIEGRTMLPIRFVAEPLGAVLDWEVETQKVTVQLMDTRVELWIGQSNALVNGVSYQIDPNNPNVKPLTINGRTMLPVRFVAESLSCDVTWEAEEQRVTITKSFGSGGNDGSAGDVGGEGDSDTPGVDDSEGVDDGEGYVDSDTPGVDDSEGVDDGEGDNDREGVDDSEGGDDGEGGEGEADPIEVDDEEVGKAAVTRLGITNSNVAKDIKKAPLTIKPGTQTTIRSVLGNLVAQGLYVKNGTVTPADKASIKTLKDIGRGYNIFGRYASSISLKNAVLDADKLVEKGQIQRTELNTSDFKEIEGESLQEYAKDMKNSANLQGEYLGFKASMDTSFSSSFRSKSTSYYNTINYLIMQDSLFIKASCNYKEYLLPDVKAILDTGTYNGRKWTPAQIFDDYGCYVLVNGIFGGRLEYNVTANSEFCSSYSNFMANVKASYNSSIGSVGGELNHEGTVNREEFAKNSATTVITYGGTAQDGSVLSANQQGPSNLQVWRDSVLSKPVLVAFGETGALIPIWELCSTTARSNELKKAFDEYAKGKEVIIPKKGATAYERVNYVGRSYVFDAGSYSNLNSINFNDMISSIKVEPGFRVRAYEHANFSGGFRIFEGGYWYDDVGARIRGKTSSMIVEEANESNKVVATIFQDVNYKGNYQELVLGSYPNMSNFFVGNDSVSSIKVAPGYKVMAYEHTNYGGKLVEFTSNTSSFGSISFNDKISSLKVVKQ